LEGRVLGSNKLTQTRTHIYASSMIIYSNQLRFNALSFSLINLLIQAIVV